MKGYYKGVLCKLGIYRLMGEDKPVLYYIDSPDQKTMLDAGFIDIHYGLWVKILSNEEYNEIVELLNNNKR